MKRVTLMENPKKRDRIKGRFEKMFQDNSGKVIKGLSLSSILASGVPGTVSGIFYAAENYGTVKIENLITPSIALAKKGFALSDFQAKNLNKYKKKFSSNIFFTLIFYILLQFKLVVSNFYLKC